jgi:hypothetical protein
MAFQSASSQRHFRNILDPMTARARPRDAGLFEASLFAGAVLLLGAAAAAVPDAVLHVAGVEATRNHLLAGVPGFALLVGWWLVRVSGDPNATFKPGRASLLACALVSQSCGLLALVLVVGSGVPGLGVGDSVVTGASLLILGGATFTLAAMSPEP